MKINEYSYFENKLGAKYKITKLTKNKYLLQFFHEGYMTWCFNKYFKTERLCHKDANI